MLPSYKMNVDLIYQQSAHSFVVWCHHCSYDELELWVIAICGYHI